MSKPLELFHALLLLLIRCLSHDAFVCVWCSDLVFQARVVDVAMLKQLHTQNTQTISKGNLCGF